MLSQLGVGSERVTLISKSNQRNQTILVAVDAIAQYSYFIEKRVTIFHFLIFQEIIESPRKIQKYVVELKSLESPTQSTYKQARDSNEYNEGNKRL